MWRHGRTGMQWRFSMVIIPAFSGTACSMDFPVVLHASRTARSQVTELTECCHLNETFIEDVRCSGRTEILFGRLSGARCILRQNEIKVVEDGTLFFFFVLNFCSLLNLNAPVVFSCLCRYNKQRQEIPLIFYKQRLASWNQIRRYTPSMWGGTFLPITSLTLVFF